MNAAETLAANEAIWSHYLRSHKHSWVDPLGLLGRSPAGREVLDAHASRIAGFLSAIAAGPFAQLYNDRATTASGEGAAGLRLEVRSSDQRVAGVRNTRGDGPAAVHLCSRTSREEA